eukprot:2853946-Lingulodinium_polyedra.AAC.1
MAAPAGAAQPGGESLHGFRRRRRLAAKSDLEARLERAWGTVWKLEARVAQFEDDLVEERLAGLGL